MHQRLAGFVRISIDSVVLRVFLVITIAVLLKDGYYGKMNPLKLRVPRSRYTSIVHGISDLFIDTIINLFLLK